MEEGKERETVQDGVPNLDMAPELSQKQLIPA